VSLHGLMKLLVNCSIKRNQCNKFSKILGTNMPTKGRLISESGMTNSNMGSFYVEKKIKFKIPSLTCT